MGKRLFSLNKPKCFPCNPHVLKLISSSRQSHPKWCGRRPKSPQNDPQVYLKRRKVTPKCPKVPIWNHLGLNFGELGANLGQLRVDLGTTWHQLRPNLGPSWRQLRPTWAKVSSKWNQTTPKWPQSAAKWPQSGSKLRPEAYKIVKNNAEIRVFWKQAKMLPM